MIKRRTKRKKRLNNKRNKAIKNKRKIPNHRRRSQKKQNQFKRLKLNKNDDKNYINIITQYTLY